MQNVNINKIYKTWGRRFKELGITQQQAAKESGLTQAQVGAYVSQKNIPNIKNFEKFENYLRRMGV